MVLWSYMKNLTETEVRSRLIRPAISASGWVDFQIAEEKSFTAGRILVHGKTIARGEKKRADFILYYKSNMPLAIVEAKDSAHSLGAGLEQAKQYAQILHIPFVYSSNGDGFVEYDFLTGKETELALTDFPSPEDLLTRYMDAKHYTSEQKEIVLQDYFIDQSGKGPRYYQETAINTVVEAVVEGRDRILLVMATGTGKTYTAFQIIYRLWKAKKKKRILFLVDRTALAQQTMSGDFRHFGSAMTRIKNGTADKAYEVYVALYQGLTGGVQSEGDIEAEEEKKKLFQDFSPDFFDLIIVDECHRGGAKENGAWREILDHYKSATQIGLTATPKETKDTSTQEYFGDPVYTYSLKQGIDDGFLAPYKVVRYRFNHDEWRPPQGFVDTDGKIVPDEIYSESMFDRTIVLEARNKAVAKCVADFMRETNPYQKVIVFCVDIAHAERMRTALSNELCEYTKQNARYVVKITGDDTFGKMEIENFINPESRYPVIATTSKLLSTGVDTKTVQLIVLDAPMNSMTEFKQIIGRGTRVEEQHGKYYFTVMDFRNVTRLFADPGFDGDPTKIYEHSGNQSATLAEAIDQETWSEDQLKQHDPRADIILDGTQTGEKPRKIRIKDGVDFYPIHKEVKYIDPKTGKLITESLREFSKKAITSEYISIDDFLTKWKESKRKDIIINELLDRGVMFEELKREVGKDLDVFDLVLHVAYGKKPMTRGERIQKVSTNDYFTKYEGKAREIIDHLLAKYADQGITAIDDIGDLMVSPFTMYGTPIEIVEDIFGGREAYLEIIQEIENSLYAE
jgi:type I restriction enzyme, R subunit